MQKKRIEEKHAKDRQHDLYVDKLFADCKGWKGPCITLDELVTIIESQPTLAEKIVRTELSYYRHTHRADVIARPELFKLNKVTNITIFQCVFIVCSFSLLTFYRSDFFLSMYPKMISIFRT